MDNASTIPAAIPAPFDEPVAAVRHRQVEATWVRPALLGLLASSAVLYLWNLAASGWANAYYYAAVQAGTKSWKAFFFGSLDASNFITIDKTPASLWVMEISARIFGLNSWSVLAPQALEGVATVFVVYLAVRRWFGPAAGLLAGAVVALTPVAALTLGVVPLVMRWRRPRRDIQRAAFLAWGGCLLLTAAVFSFSLGIIHPYYTVALAPAIGALVGMGAGFLWERRSETSARLALSAAVVASAVWSYMLLS